MDMNKRRYINFHNGFWVVTIKKKSISRHRDVNEAIIARDNYIKEHPELCLVYKDKMNVAED